MGPGRAEGFMIAIKQKSKTVQYLVGLLCALPFAVVFGCTAESPSRGAANQEHSATASSQKSVDVPKKEVSVLDTKGHEKAVTSPISEKVSSSLRAMIEKMESLGITTENANELKASSLSTPLVRVNDRGSIQTYVYVTTFGVDEKALLEERDMVIEIINEKLGIIQAWIPYNKIDEVAQFPFVKRITAPRYGTPRGGSVNMETDAIFSLSKLNAKEDKVRR
jgi:hypothetical protein